MTRATECKALLKELDAAVERFRGLGRPGRRLANWEGIRWDEEAAQNFRDRLNANIGLLTNLYAALLVSSQVRVETALNTLIEEIRNQKRSAKSVSRLTATDGPSEEIAWPLVVTDLESVGLERELAEQNRPFIVDWLFQKAREYLWPDDEDQEQGRTQLDAAMGSNTAALRNMTLDLPSAGRSHQRASSSSATQDDEGLGSPVTSTASLHVIGSPLEKSATIFQRFMEPFGENGERVAEEVRRNRNTFKEDLTRTRMYWERSNWAEAKKYLLRVLVATPLSRHRNSDISARTAAFLLGVAYQKSGDLEMAKNIMLSILSPVDETGNLNDRDPSSGLYDEGQIAAATWLGDLCFKTNRIESAAFAWALAFDAAVRRVQIDERNGSRPFPENGSVGSQSPAPLSPEGRSPRNRRRSRMLAGSRSVLWSQSQTRVLLFKLAFTEKYLCNLSSLEESLNSDLDPDGDESIFAESHLMSKEHMYRITDQALEAVERADGSILDERNRSKEAHMMRLDLVPPVPESESDLSNANKTGSNAGAPTIIPAEEYFHMPVRATRWPLEYDVDFALPSAIRLIDWYFGSTPLRNEGVLHNMQLTDLRTFREHRSMTFADNINARNGEAFVTTLKRMIRSIRFECREAPGLLRCRNRTDQWSRYPKAACFAFRIVKYKPENFLHRRERLGAYLSDVVYWNGEIEDKTPIREDTKNLVSEMKTLIELYDAEARGRLLPNTAPDVTGIAA